MSSNNKKLEPVHGFDYFLVLLSNKTLIYNRDGVVIPIVEIANTKFGEVKRLMDTNQYFIEVK